MEEHGFARHAHPRRAHRRRHRDGGGHPAPVADPARRAARAVSRIAGHASPDRRAPRAAMLEDTSLRGMLGASARARDRRRRSRATAIALGWAGAGEPNALDDAGPAPAWSTARSTTRRARPRSVGRRARGRPAPRARLRRRAPSASTATSRSRCYDRRDARRCGSRATASACGRSTTCATRRRSPSPRGRAPCCACRASRAPSTAASSGLFAASHYRTFDNDRDALALPRRGPAPGRRTLLRVADGRLHKERVVDARGGARPRRPPERAGRALPRAAARRRAACGSARAGARPSRSPAGWTRRRCSPAPSSSRARGSTRSRRSTRGSEYDESEEIRSMLDAAVEQLAPGARSTRPTCSGWWRGWSRRTTSRWPPPPGCRTTCSASEVAQRRLRHAVRRPRRRRAERRRVRVLPLPLRRPARRAARRTLRGARSRRGCATTTTRSSARSWEAMEAGLRAAGRPRAPGPDPPRPRPHRALPRARSSPEFFDLARLRAR